MHEHLPPHHRGLIFRGCLLGCSDVLFLFLSFVMVYTMNWRNAQQAAISAGLRRVGSHPNIERPRKKSSFGWLTHPTESNAIDTAAPISVTKTQGQNKGHEQTISPQKKRDVETSGNSPEEL